MKDHTFDARNDEMRARAQRPRKTSTPAQVEEPKAESPTTDAEPGSIAALADATDAAIRASSPAPTPTATKRKSTRKTTDRAPAPKPAKMKVASLAKSIDAAIVADKVAPDFNPLAGAGAASTDLLKSAAKKSRAPRAVAKSETPNAKPAKVDWLDTGLDRTGKLTVDELARAWIAHLEEDGKATASTIASYANDLKTAIAFFGADSPVAGINAAYVNEFNISDGVMKLKSGEPKAMPTILKMRRAFRMALEWARENEVVAHVE